MTIENLRKPIQSNLLSQYDARCEWAILEGIQKLLDLTKDMTKKRVENSAPLKKQPLYP